MDAPCEHVVSIWCLTLSHRGVDDALLSDAERVRASRFLRDQDRNRWVAARAGLRRVLALETGQDAASLEFALTAHGKPTLQGERIFFNVSHSGSLGIIATSAHSPLGVDIESGARLTELDGLAEIVMSPTERQSFNRLDVPRRRQAFLRLWTRKEAVLKADGRGLSLDPTALSVGFDHASTIRLELDGTAWTILDLDIDAPGAIACAGSPRLCWRSI